MRYLSVCSGIEAASVAWPGWTPVAFSEIEPFPCAVLQHHYPDVPNLGDVTRYADWPELAPDVVVGGTPCQSFSVAGLRAGLADPRGNLALVFLGVVDRYRPRWVVWENVPGVLSSRSGEPASAPPDRVGVGPGEQVVDECEYDETSDFECFLDALTELGYGWSWASLDAQYFGLAQRRERVFVVGHLGDWRPPVAVLFEPESLSGTLAPRRETGEGVAPTIASRPTGGGGLGTDFDCDGGVIQHCPEVSPAMKQRDHKGPSSDGDGDGDGLPLIAVTIPLQEVNARQSKSQNGVGIGIGDGTDPMYTLQSGQQHGVAVAFGISSDAIDRSGEGDGSAAQRAGLGIVEECSPTIRANPRNAVAVALRGREGGATAEMGDDVGMALRSSQGGGDKPHVLTSMAVRRLTPRECERLQGFPDDYTLIPYRGKPAADGPRYKALGNSFAIPVVRWIGERVALFESEHQPEAA